MAWAWAVATCRGTSHVKDGSECQDASRCIAVGPNADIIAAVVCDGMGSATFGKQGAAITCRTISERARSHFSSSDALPSDDEVWEWLDDARENISKGAVARATERREFSCTLVAVLATASDTVLLHIGDGAPVVQFNGEWIAPSWPAHGEYASQTYFVTDDPAPQLRITRLGGPVSAVAAFSDGIERLVLDFANRTAPPAFFEGMLKPLSASTAVGRDQKLCLSLRRYLDGDKINERTDDDKSLILALRR